MFIEQTFFDAQFEFETKEDLSKATDIALTSVDIGEFEERLEYAEVDFINWTD